MDDVLLPVIDEYSQPFWDGALQGELRIQGCGNCNRLRFPPRPMCPHCQSTDVTWRTMSGRGTIYSFVVAHPPLLPGYQAIAPYPVVVVALDEDPSLRMVGNLVASEGGAINEVDPSAIEIGRRVSVVFEQVADDIALPRWLLLD